METVLPDDSFYPHLEPKRRENEENVEPKKMGLLTSFGA